MNTSIYQFEVQTNKGEAISLENYQDKVMLVVNTASACGFTPQYAGLESLYNAYKDKGLIILAFPCNQFGKQEKGSDNDIQQFCDLNFNISFPVMKKTLVNGPNAEPLFQYLKSHAKGMLGTESIKWNFTKFLINRHGEVIKRYGSRVKPEQIKQDIENLL